MNCERMEALLISYLDGRASDAERRDAQAHLAECAACRKRAEEFRGVWSALDELPRIEPSAAFDARLRARIAEEPRTAWLAWLVPSPRLAFSVSALLILGAWLSSLPPVGVNPSATKVRSDEEFKMIKELPVLEDYEVLANFEPLNELPKTPTKNDRKL